MLTHMHVKDFTLVDQLDIELHEGLTAITGETGAGKSIMLGALGLTLGDRSDGSKVRAGCERADIHASFDISTLRFAQKWLRENDLEQGDECILRRVITKEGRSRAYINGQTVTLQQLRSFGERLIDIHSQHEHQSLLMPQTHRRLVDDFANASQLSQDVKHAYYLWQNAYERLQQAQHQGEEIDARFQLLSYQVDELNQLDLQENELEELEREQRILSSAESTQQHCQSIIDICDSDGVGLKDRMAQAIRLFNELTEKPETLAEVDNLLQTALISIEEAQSDISRYLDDNNQDPARLHHVDQRLNSIYEIARKHRVAPDQLSHLHHSLAEELSKLQSGDELLATLEQEVSEQREHYDALAGKLSQKRQRASTKLASAVNKKFASLAMASAKLKVALEKAEEPSKHGNEKIEFLISTNPGQAPQPLQKVASGGELSRVSLAIQVVTAQTSTTPTLVFDEIDVGIGGTTGDVIGNMLRELGSKGQIFCVTHLAQVASKAHHHYRVEKHVTKKQASSSLEVLQGDEKIIEIARMMGGSVESKQSLAHAKQMLKAATSDT
ncbi:DNA repair protein RecN [Agarilytica rhodophyticola]|uniref:DNA repair protein RecN n=1 Tax=Agarilytica rhodophyticola TaxID=1737490 RepID=UPI000B3467FD|nr:DNA repair protein RecN [Agarilytica rhodophyticola]